MTTTEELCQRYIGLEFKRKGRNKYTICPVHGEKTASLCLYPNGRLYCFGCNLKADGLDLMAIVNGLSLKEVINKVATDYGIISTSGDIEQRREISKKIIMESQQRELVEKYWQQVEACYIYLVGKYKETLTIEKSLKTMSDLSRLDVAMAFEMQPIINGILDLLASDEIEEQFNGLRWAVRMNLWQSQV